MTVLIVIWNVVHISVAIEKITIMIDWFAFSYAICYICKLSIVKVFILIIVTMCRDSMRRLFGGKRIPLLALLILLALAGCVYFVLNYAFGFVSLFVLLIVFLFLLRFVGIKVGPVNNPLPKSAALLLSVIIIIFFGMMCIVSFGQYINPKRGVFTNNDHHAFAVEGITFSTPSGINLAGNSSDAFFDSDSYDGTLTMGAPYKSTSFRAGDTITVLPVKGYGFSMPVYSSRFDSTYFLGIHSRLTLKAPRYFKDMDNGAEDSFTSGEEVVLSQRGTSVSFSVIERTDSLGSKYILRYTDGNGELREKVSAFSVFLRKSYPLSSLFPDVNAPGFNFEGIVLMRTLFFDTDIDNPKKVYQRLGAAYRFAFTNVADKDTRIQIHGAQINPFSLIRHYDFMADGRTVYSVGASEDVASQFRLDSAGAGVSLRFRMPKYRYLSADNAREGKERESLSFMVATTILNPDGTVNQLIPENILLYDFFDHPDNQFQMNPAFLSFVNGATNDELEFSLYSADGSIDASGLKAGDSFPALSSNNSVASWIVSVDNFKDPQLVRPGELYRPLSARKLGVILVVVILLSIIALCIDNGYDYPFTYVEPMVYLILLAFLTVRLFLLWRISVFPPVMSTTVSEFNGIFRSERPLKVIEILLGVFYLTIILVKKWGTRSRSALLNWLGSDVGENYSERQLTRFFWILFAIIPACMAGVGVGLKLLHVTSRIACILIPLTVFLVTDFVSNRLFGGLYRKDFGFHLDLRYLLVLASNSVCTWFYCFVMDGGFGMIFMVFASLNIIMRIIDAYLVKQLEGEANHIVGAWVYVLSVLAVLFVVFFKDILLLLLKERVFALLLFFLLLAVFFAVLFAFKVIRKEDGHLTVDRKGWIILGVGLSVCIAVSLLSLRAPHIFEGKHIEYRLKVHTGKPGDVLGQLKSVSAERKFMQASINDWIMMEYSERGKTVASVLGEGGQGYFKIQPQSKVGALWGAQTTDISLSRYIIAEHGHALPIWMIVVLGFLLIFCVGFVSNRVWSKALITQIPLLLVVQALLVWMAVTHRFIFLGQDFPMISITSNLTSVVFIGLLTVLVSVASLEATICEDSDEATHVPVIIQENDKLFKHVLVFSLSILVLLLGWGEHSRNKKIYSSGDSKKVKIAAQYNVKNCIDALQTSLDELNKVFAAYQHELMPGNKDKDITKVVSAYECLKDFCATKGYEPGTDHNLQYWFDQGNEIAVTFNKGGEGFASFCKMAFDRFVERGSRKNEIDGLIYLAKKKTRNRAGYLNVVYELKSNEYFYHRELPRTIKDSWKGNIVSAPLTTIAPDSAFVAAEGQYAIYSLPKSWTKTKVPVRLIRSNSRNMVVVGRQKPLVLSRGESCTIKDADNVLVDGKVMDMSKFGNVSYLAKNVMINGQSSFVYPLQDKLFWIRPFADGIRYDKASNDAKKKASYEDVRLSLSPTLTSAIFDVIEKQRGKDKGTAVIVADGNGRIISMVDHKEAEYRINPNDSRSIVKKENELRLEGEYTWGQEAENYFGNKVITNLRFGPGSSQKPLTWTAVTTQYGNVGFWSNLKLAQLNKRLMAVADESHFSATHVSGTPFSPGKTKAYFQSLKGDEGRGNHAVDLSFYIWKSSNYYNAMMAFFGSFSKDSLEHSIAEIGKRDNPLFQTVPTRYLNSSSDKEEYRNRFPIMQEGDGDLFSFRHIPSLTMMRNANNSLLVKGLTTNFNLPTVNDRQLRPKIYTYETDKARDLADFGHPMTSYFSNVDRESSSQTERADNAIRFTALGASSVWQVSPLIMAQMYGNLIKMDRSYHLTLDPTLSAPMNYQRFDIDGVDPSRDNIGEYHSIRSTMVDAMSQVFRNGEGTAYDVLKRLERDYSYSVNKNDGSIALVSSDGRSRKLYLYGKTGTINGTDYEGDNPDPEDHLLSVIITDRDIRGITNFDTKPGDGREPGFKSVKFYVIYFADFDTSAWHAWQASDAAVIDVVLKSKEFRRYMSIE